MPSTKKRLPHTSTLRILFSLIGLFLFPQLPFPQALPARSGQQSGTESDQAIRQILFSEDFESGQGDWNADNGVWEVGVPTSGPKAAHGGVKVAATILNGNYPTSVKSRLISPSIFLPSVAIDEEILLRFWNWFSYARNGHCVYVNDCVDDIDNGQVSVSVYENGKWSEWINGWQVNDKSVNWSRKEIELTAYAGRKIRIGFLHADDPDGAVQDVGWYIDDVTVEKVTPKWDGSFESGWGDWSVNNGVWEIGQPTYGPTACHGGNNCAATVLNDKYPTRTMSRLSSPTIILPNVSTGEEILLRFWNWFSYARNGHCVYVNDCVDDIDYGQVSLSVYENGKWSDWVNRWQVDDKSVNWSRKEVDLTAYAGKKIRIGFIHADDPDGAVQDAGWYIDDVTVEKVTPKWDGSFEFGWGDWSVNNGVWEIGQPTYGPTACHGGNNCAATVLNGKYPRWTQSQLISPSVQLPSISTEEEILLRFWNWFSYNSPSRGRG